MYSAFLAYLTEKCHPWLDCPIYYLIGLIVPLHCSGYSSLALVCNVPLLLGGADSTSARAFLPAQVPVVLA